MRDRLTSTTVTDNASHKVTLVTNGYDAAGHILVRGTVAMVFNNNEAFFGDQFD